MSLETLLSILANADKLDRQTTPVRFHRLRKVGCAVLLVGSVGAVVSGIAGAACAAATFVAIAAMGILLLFVYAMEAKLYGYVAIGAVLLFLGACFGIAALASAP